MGVGQIAGRVSWRPLHILEAPFRFTSLARLDTSGCELYTAADTQLLEDVEDDYRGVGHSRRTVTRVLRGIDKTPVRLVYSSAFNTVGHQVRLFSMSPLHAAVLRCSLRLGLGDFGLAPLWMPRASHATNFGGGVPERDVPVNVSDVHDLSVTSIHLNIFLFLSSPRLIYWPPVLFLTPPSLLTPRTRRLLQAARPALPPPQCASAPATSWR